MARDNKHIEQIEKQAYEWLSIMHSDCKTREEVKQFQIWIEADTRHKAVYDEIYSLWQELPNLQGVIDPDSYHYPKTRSFRQKFIPFEPGMGRQILAGLAGCLVLFAVAFVIFMQEPLIHTEGANDFATKTAEIREIGLPDNSMITLGALSAVEVNYSDKERRVELISGEAFFAVERNTAKPFVVTVADTEIRVLGTKFDVRRSRTGVRISVLEGKVEVMQTGSDDRHRTKSYIRTKQILKARERIRTEPDGGLSDIHSLRQSHPGAWRQGRLIYENAKLAEVISDADRYYSGNIIIDTEDLLEIAVSAAFRTDQIQEMMDTLSIVLPISVRKLSNGDIVIRRQDNSQG